MDPSTGLFRSERRRFPAGQGDEKVSSISLSLFDISLSPNCKSRFSTHPKVHSGECHGSFVAFVSSFCWLIMIGMEYCLFQSAGLLFVPEANSPRMCFHTFHACSKRLSKGCRLIMMQNANLSCYDQLHSGRITQLDEHLGHPRQGVLKRLSASHLTHFVANRTAKQCSPGH